MCVTVERSDMSKFTEGSWQGSFTVNNERAVRTLKPSSEQKKKCFERIPLRPEFACKFSDWISSVLQSPQTPQCRVLCILADVQFYSKKKNIGKS